MRVLRRGLAVLQSVWPEAAAAILESVFVRPPRHAPRPGETAALRSGTPGTVSWSTPRARGRLRTWRFGPAGPSVLLVHGWGGRAGQWAAFIEPLRAAGLSVVAFDGPGHGRSTGRTASLPEFAAAVRAVAAEHGDVRVIVAHSLGAAAAGLALEQGLDVDAVVLLAPPRSPLPFFQALAAALGASAQVRQRALARLRRRVGVGVEDLDFARSASRLRATPVLVVHDREDAEVPWIDGAAVAAAWAGAEVTWTRGLGHRRILRAAPVVTAAVDFVSERVPGARCGCGRVLAEHDCPQCSLEREMFAPALRSALA